MISEANDCTLKDMRIAVRSLAGLKSAEFIVLPLLVSDRICFGSSKEFLSSNVVNSGWCWLDFSDDDATTVRMSQADRQKAIMDTLAYWTLQETIER